MPLGVAVSIKPGGFLFDPKGFFQPAGGYLKTLGDLWDLPCWEQWRSGDYPLNVVVDGVDEGVLKIGDFLPKLSDINAA